MLHSMPNQVSTQLEVLLSLLRHIMTLIVIVTAWSSDNLAEGGNLLILQKHNLILAIDSLLVYNSLSCILHEANVNESLPHSSIIGHGHMIIKHVKSAQRVQFCEHFHQNSCVLDDEHAPATKWGLVVLYNKSMIINLIFIMVAI